MWTMEVVAIFSEKLAGNKKKRSRYTVRRFADIYLSYGVIIKHHIQLPAASGLY